jgi:hypothetical protein
MIGGGVFDGEDGLLQNGVRAEGETPPAFATREADGSFEPLAVCVDEAYEADRGAAESGREHDEFVELRLGVSIENSEGAQSGKAFGFVGGDCGCLHGGSSNVIIGGKRGAGSGCAELKQGAGIRAQEEAGYSLIPTPCSLLT